MLAAMALALSSVIVLGLGAINAVATVLALAASAMTGGDALVQLATGRLDPNDPQVNDAALAGALLACRTWRRSLRVWRLLRDAYGISAATGRWHCGGWQEW